MPTLAEDLEEMSPPVISAAGDYEDTLHRTADGIRSDAVGMGAQ